MNTYNWWLAKHIKYNTNKLIASNTANDNKEPMVYTEALEMEYNCTFSDIGSKLGVFLSNTTCFPKIEYYIG